MLSLEHALALRQDNFKLVRLLAASAVIYGHAHALANNQSIPRDLVSLVLDVSYSGEVAVWAFFVVSGFLVMGSWHHSQDVRVFLQARARRVWPGLLAVLLITTLLLGPLCSTRSFAQYFADSNTWQYFYGNALYFHLQWDLPGVFLQNQRAGIVNGSLWTLPFEVISYFAVALAGWLGVFKRPKLTGVTCIVLAAAFFPCMRAHGMQFIRPEHEELFFAFALGASAFLLRRFIPISALGVLAAAMIVLLCGGQVELKRLSIILFIGYFAFWLAYAFKPWAWLERRGDYSYGIYLWGFPIQQALTHHFHTWNAVQLALASWLLVLIPAGLSWHFVEKYWIKPRRLQGANGANQSCGAALLLKNKSH
jgi:peptidoglycan/LPS O-acetylase OafA/YrhL